MIIGRGAQGTVELEPASGLVCKQFRMNPAEAANLAQREFEYLKRFSAVLTPLPFLHCPEPVRVEPDKGKVWMTYCPGSTLEHALEDSGSAITPHLDHLAEQIALGVELYINEFDQPFDDLATNNMLYDPSTRNLYLVDFATPVFSRQFSLEQAPVEFSLGCFLGTTTYHTVRPATFSNRGYWKRQGRLSAELLARLATRHDLLLPLIQRVSTAVYHSVGTGRKGRPLRQLWYATVGQIIFNRRSRSILFEQGMKYHA
jgi:hypothetical protein